MPTPQRTTPVTRLGEWRARRGLSLAEAAVFLDYDRSYVSRLERGLRRPSGRALHRIAHRTGLSRRELFLPPEARS